MLKTKNKRNSQDFTNSAPLPEPTPCKIKKIKLDKNSGIQKNSK